MPFIDYLWFNETALRASQNNIKKLEQNYSLSSVCQRKQLLHAEGRTDFKKSLKTNCKEQCVSSLPFWSSDKNIKTLKHMNL